MHMPGLDKILNAIRSSGEQSAEAIIREAEAKAGKIRSDGEESARQAYEEHMEKTRLDCEREYSSACSSAEAEMKRKLLACKSQCIDEAVEKALAQIAELPDDEYFGMILKLAGERLLNGHGIISFGKRDLARIPQDFEKNLNLLASIDGSSLSISHEPADIESGFILSYGDITENCSFRAVAEAESEAIRDKAASILFAG